jgi:Uma2 family endonuclease
MTIATAQRMTLEAFLHHESGTENRYELVDGVLVEMGAESTDNTSIAMALAFFFMQQLGIPAYRVALKHLIRVSSTKVTARDPDLIVHSVESYGAIAGATESLLKPEHPLPLLVVEVVSPGKPGSLNYDRDYVDKPVEYADRGIPEYWILDPQRKVVLVLSLEAGRYRSTRFEGDQAIVSPTFSALPLTANQVLNPF